MVLCQNAIIARTSVEKSRLVSLFCTYVVHVSRNTLVLSAAHKLTGFICFGGGGDGAGVWLTFRSLRNSQKFNFVSTGGENNPVQLRHLGSAGAANWPTASPIRVQHYRLILGQLYFVLAEFFTIWRLSIVPIAAILLSPRFSAAHLHVQVRP